jgi:serine/threonine protein kinase
MSKNKLLFKLLVSLALIESMMSEKVYQDPMSPYCQRISKKKKKEYMNRVTLGKGSFGTVTQSSSKNVVKILDFKKNNAKYQKNFENILEEIIMMSDIKKRFPDIKDIQVLESCYYEDIKDQQMLKFYLEQKKLGLDFRHILKSKKDWPFDWYISIIEKITQSLRKLHETGYAHLDLKPENIMMSDIETPVLIDFGFSEYLYDSDTESSQMNNEARRYYFVKGLTAKGSPKFIAPEIWYETAFSFSADFYALGVSVMEMMNPKQQIYNKSIKSSRNSGLELAVPLEQIINDNLQSVFEADNSYAPFFFKLINGLIKTDIVGRFYVDEVLEELNNIKNERNAFCQKNENKPLPVCKPNLNKQELQQIAENLMKAKKKTNRVILL